MNLSKNVNILPIAPYAAASMTAQTSDIIDMAGYDGVVFVVSFGTLITGGTLNVQVLQNTLNQVGGMTAVSGTSAYTVLAGDAALAKNCIVLDVFQPTKRYLEVVTTPAVQNAVITGVTAIRYSGRVKPKTAGAMRSALLQSPE